MMFMLPGSEFPLRFGMRLHVFPALPQAVASVWQLMGFAEVQKV